MEDFDPDSSVTDAEIAEHARALDEWRSSLTRNRAVFAIALPLLLVSILVLFTGWMFVPNTSEGSRLIGALGGVSLLVAVVSAIALRLFGAPSEAARLQEGITAGESLLETMKEARRADRRDS